MEELLLGFLFGASSVLFWSYLHTSREEEILRRIEARLNEEKSGAFSEVISQVLKKFPVVAPALRMLVWGWLSQHPQISQVPGLRRWFNYIFPGSEESASESASDSDEETNSSSGEETTSVDQENVSQPTTQTVPNNETTNQPTSVPDPTPQEDPRVQAVIDLLSRGLSGWNPYAGVQEGHRTPDIDAIRERLTRLQNAIPVFSE